MSSIKLDPKTVKRQYYVYALRLKQGRYYIGITTNIKRRLWQHYAGKGARFTMEYPPIKTLGVIDLGIISKFDAVKEEKRYTLKAVKKYGALVVRGWAHTTTITQLKDLKKFQEQARAY